MLRLASAKLEVDAQLALGDTVKLTFLAADVPLTKSFSLDEKGALVKSSYPLVSEFTSYDRDAPNLKVFAELLEEHAKDGQCLLKGNVLKPLHSESRAGSTDSNALTDWVCLDLDGAIDLKNPEELLDEVPLLRGVDYVLQYSASHKVDPRKKFSAHIFMQLEEPQMPSIIKTWLKSLNLELPILNAGLSLTRTNMALRWPLDITTCQNDKLLYIAPPVLGKGIKAPRLQRITYVRRGRRTIGFDATQLNAELVAKKANAKISEMRKALGLPDHKLTTRINDKGTEIMPKPGQAQVTGIREKNGFVYLNLNGGDSFGYFHPVTKPDVIYNFKGEPNYLTKELLPEYYAQCLKRDDKPDPHAADEEKSGVFYLAFLDRLSDSYYRGTWDPATSTIDIAPTNSVRKVNDFLVCHGQGKADSIPEWSYRFAFNDPRLIEPETRFINRYQPTRYMSATKRKGAKVPETINKLINHVMPSEEAVERFLNWLAVIYQLRIKPGTAWIWTGTQGVGKGLLFSKVLRPIFGANYTAEYPIGQLENDFNAFLEDSVLVMIDEAQREGLKSEEKVLAKLKHYITEDHISIRRLYANHFLAKSFTSFIIASNEDAPLFIAYNDRRFNVSPPQPNKIRISAKEIERINEELDDFATYLASREADEALARTPLLNKAREDMMARTQTTPDRVAAAFKTGDLSFFIEAHTNVMEVVPGAKNYATVQAYDMALRQICEKALLDKEAKVWREQLRAIFEHLVGDMPQGVTKFGQYMGHRGIHYERMYHEDRGCSHQGIQVTWKVDQDEVRAFLARVAGKQAPAPVENKVTPITKGKKRS